MRIFLDTEFQQGLDRRLHLISVGAVREDGREFYAESLDYAIKVGEVSGNPVPRLEPDPWVMEHVWPHLGWRLRDADARGWFGKAEREALLYPLADTLIVTESTLALLLRGFCQPDRSPAPEVWGYYAGYDFVVVSQLLGGFSQYPTGWPFLFYDLRQALDFAGLEDVRQPDDAPHHALLDARWVRDTYEHHLTLRDGQVCYGLQA